MTAHEVIAEAAKLGIVLEARGDRLHVEAPAGVVTPELRETLARHKAALLALLAPVSEYITLKGGLIVPAPALQLVWSLEDRQFRMGVDRDGQFQIEPPELDPSDCPTCGRDSCEGADDPFCRPAGLTVEDQAGITRWHLHLAALVAYVPPEVS